jgi:hypothetical protein
MPLAAFGIFLPETRRRRRLLPLTIVVALVLMMLACGGGVSGGGDAPPIIRPGTPAGTHPITVTGTGGTIVKSANFTLTVQ